MDEFEGVPNRIKYLKFEAFHLSSVSASDDGDFKALIAKRKVLSKELEKCESIFFGKDPDQEGNINVKQEAVKQVEFCRNIYKSNIIEHETIDNLGINPTLHGTPEVQKDGNHVMLQAALQNGHLDIAEEVIAQCDKKLLLLPFEDSKTPLQYITENGNVKLAECLLRRLDRDDEKFGAIKAETVVEVKGQRPRSLSCFHLAAFKGFTELVKLYVQVGVDIDFKNSKRDTALLWASRWGHYETVKYLLNQHADCMVENDKNSTALHWAVRYEHLEVASLLLTLGKADPNKERLQGLVAPIVLASALGNSKMVNILIQNGANPNHTIRNGETPLHVAAAEGHDGVLLLLLDNNADINRKDENGNTPILNAASNNHLMCVYILSKAGADTNIRNHIERDVWDFAIDSDDNTAFTILCKTSKTVNCPHLKAAKMGRIDKVKIVRNCGIDITSTDVTGNTLIHYAANFDKYKLISEFSSLIDINIKNKRGNTALHIACSKGNLYSIKALIAAKARADVSNNVGRMPLHMTAVSRCTTPEIVQILVEYVIKSHTWECLNSADKNGDNALHLAAESASPDILWEFRHIRFKDLDQTGNTPLHDSVRPNEEQVLETMLDIFETMQRDANINSRNKNKETVLHLACTEGFTESVARIIFLGGDLSIQDQNGHTMLHRLVLKSSNIEDDVKKEATIRECVGMIETIINNAVIWWCIKNKFRIPDKEESYYTKYKRDAILFLLHDIRDGAGLSVIGLACHYAAADFLLKCMTIENITCFYREGITLYDVTYFSPRTKNSLDTDHNVLPYLQTLVCSSDRQNAALSLNIPPLRKMEEMFKNVCMAAYLVLIVLHVTYMSVLSYSGIYLLGRLRAAPDALERDYLFCYFWTVLEPIAIILYFITSIGLSLKRRQSLVASFPWKFFLMFFVFAVLAIVWLVFLAVRNTINDYIFSILLCHGWLLTIAFTRGIKGIHYFWEMLKMMILRDILRFLVFYLLVLLAFSFAFHSLFQISQTLSSIYLNPGDTMFMVINVMMGFGEVFDDNFENGLKAVGRTTAFSKAIYLFYIVLATIILLNLLIAMMNDSYSRILATAKINWRTESVKIGIGIERAINWTTFPFKWLQYTDMDGSGKRWFVKVYDKETFISKKVDDSIIEYFKGEFKQSITNQRSTLGKIQQDFVKTNDILEVQLRKIGDLVNFLHEDGFGESDSETE